MMTLWKWEDPASSQSMYAKWEVSLPVRRGGISVLVPIVAAFSLFLASFPVPSPSGLGMRLVDIPY